MREKYLDGSELSGRMRAILIDWLVQVHLRFHLLQETLYLTVAIIDRFLQVQLLEIDLQFMNWTIHCSMLVSL